LAAGGRSELAGSARLVLVDGVAHLDPERAVFEGMLAGWERQQRARLLGSDTVTQRLRLVQRFAAFTNEYPWQWTPGDVEDFVAKLRCRERPAALSTLRGYEMALRLFCAFVTDARYGWAELCEERFGTHPVQICHEWNTGVHAAAFEGRPGRRPFTREELQSFFDHADAEVSKVVAGGRKGALAAFRDAVCFKVVYAWGLRRREAVMLDVADWHPASAAPSLGRFGCLHVRYGKAVKGSPPRRRSVLSVFDWATEAVGQYLAEVRPGFEPGEHPAMWVTERRGRISPRALNDRFCAYRRALGLPEELDLHALRHSYVTHLIEDGYPERFVSEQVGHAYAATTAIYTAVSDEWKNRVLKAALAKAFTPVSAQGSS
jgi:site-specific recombinase XerD